MSVDSLDTNLLASGRKPKAPAPEQNDNPNPKLRAQLLKLGAYAAIFWAALSFFFYLKLPSSLVEGLVLGNLNQTGIGLFQAERVSAGLLLLPHITAENLSVDPPPGSPLPFPLAFDEIRLTPSLFSLIPWTGSVNPSFRFSGRAYGAEFSGSAKLLAKGGLSALELSLEGFDVSKFPPQQESGMGLKGVLKNLAADYHDGSGNIRVEGQGIVVDPAALKIPMVLPILDLGVISAQANGAQGKWRIERLLVGSPGKDLELKVTGEVQMATNLMQSRADLRIRLKPAEKILRALPAVKDILGSLGALQPDGFYAMKLQGPLGASFPQPDR